MISHLFFLCKIFIDYGEGWEDAWVSHVKDWTPYELTESNYSPLSQMSEHDIRTADELETNPYPDNMQLLCYLGRIYDDELDEHEEDTGIVDGTKGFHGTADELDVQEYSLPCKVLEKDDESQEYNIGVTYKGTKYVVKRMPKSSIRKRMKNYSSDQFLKTAFRHFIEIDDDIFPSQWKR